MTPIFGAGGLREVLRLESWMKRITRLRTMATIAMSRRGMIENGILARNRSWAVLTNILDLRLQVERGKAKVKVERHDSLLRLATSLYPSDVDIDSDFCCLTAQHCPLVID